MLGRVLTALLFAAALTAQEDVRSHQVQHFPDDTAPIVSTVIRTGERGRTIIVLARSTATGDQLVATVPEGSTEVAVEGLEPIALRAGDALHPVWTLTCGEKAWVVSPNMSEEEMLSVRQAFRDEVDTDLLWLVEQLTDRHQQPGLWMALTCPRTPERNDRGRWMCPAIFEATVTPIAPDCAFDASFGYPCDDDRKAAVRAAEARGELLSEY